MKTIIWKEIRENIKWAMLGLLGMSLTMFIVIESTTMNLSFDLLYSGEFQVLCIFGFSGLGFLMGLLQTLPEVNRDRWAFLVHRPLTRSHLFYGKVCSGLILYLLAAGLPLTCAFIWVATPGNLPGPFDWHMTLPGIAYFLNGTVYYFAGILVGTRQARWFGSRVLPITVAIFGSIWVASATEFWHALVVIAFFLAIGCVTAWGSFVSSGQYRSQHRSAKSMLGLTLLTSICLIGVITFVLAMQLLTRWQTGASWDSYLIDGQGRIVRATQFMSGSDRLRTTAVTDIEGRPVLKPSELNDYGYIPDVLNCRVRRTEWETEAQQRWMNTYRHRHIRLLKYTNEYRWFYVQRTGRVAIYSSDTRRMVGSLGPDGFAPAGKETRQRFEGEPVGAGFFTNTTLLVFPEIVYSIDRNVGEKPWS
ncbi:MAG: hypothetical protein ACYTBZ_05450, partial [Planctomycetota bacterium]